MLLHVRQGSIEAIVGCMSSGKSEELIRRVRRAQIAKLGTVVFKPLRDTRCDAHCIASRDGTSHGATAVADALGIMQQVKDGHTVIGLDEAQFFDANVVMVAQTLVDMGRRVIVAGLDTDFRGRPFGHVPQLMAIADEVTKLHAVCMKCGGTATRTQILFAPPEDLSDPAFVGGDEKYEARCRDCHTFPR